MVKEINFLKGLVVLIFGFLLANFCSFILKKIPEIQKRKIVLKVGEEKRLKTIFSAISSTLNFLIYLSAILLTAKFFGLNLTPVLASLGILGLAVGMAARDILADFLAGFFILLENLYQVDDEVEILGVKGKVREINLRRTIIEDESGYLHSIPNSLIKTISKKIK
jgi:small conductance mechanosensitive channel